MIFDCHLHTNASPDGKMLPGEAIFEAEKKGLGIIFTEHIDHDANGKQIFCVDLNKYPSDYVKYKDENVLIGAEIGLVADGETAEMCIDLNRGIAANSNYDFILGSVHLTDGIDIGYAPDIFFSRGIEVYQSHLIYMLDMIKKNDYIDALGHIDYISRYSPFEEENVLYGEYNELYDEILLELVKRDIVLELSTRRINDKRAVKNLVAIYKKYHDFGGRYVTLGSDAHNIDGIGYGFDTAMQFIKEMGLVPVYFKERRMFMC